MKRIIMVQPFHVLYEYVIRLAVREVKIVLYVKLSTFSLEFTVDSF